jgi:hypothetical protein
MEEVDDVRLVKVIKFIGDRAGALTWLHKKSYYYYRFINKIVTGLFGVCGVVTGGNILPLALANSNTSTIEILSIVVIVIGIFTTIMAALNIDETASRHNELSKSNSELHIDCSSYIYDATQSVAPNEFIKTILKREYIIHSDFIRIPKIIHFYYNRVYGQRAITPEVLYLLHSWDTSNILNELQIIEDAQIDFANSKYKCCCCNGKNKKDTIREINAEQVIDKMLDVNGKVHSSILENIANHPMSQESLSDIQKVIANHHKVSPGTRRKHSRHKQTTQEIFEQQRMQ